MIERGGLKLNLALKWGRRRNFGCLYLVRYCLVREVYMWVIIVLYSHRWLQSSWKPFESHFWQMVLHVGLKVSRTSRKIQLSNMWLLILCLKENVYIKSRLAWVFWNYLKLSWLIMYWNRFCLCPLISASERFIRMLEISFALKHWTFTEIYSGPSPLTTRILICLASHTRGTYFALFDYSS